MENVGWDNVTVAVPESFAVSLPNGTSPECPSNCCSGTAVSIIKKTTYFGRNQSGIARFLG
jgi:hypothetical protein